MIDTKKQKNLNGPHSFITYVVIFFFVILSPFVYAWLFLFIACLSFGVGVHNILRLIFF